MIILSLSEGILAAPPPTLTNPEDLCVYCLMDVCEHAFLRLEITEKPSSSWDIVERAIKICESTDCKPFSNEERFRMVAEHALTSSEIVPHAEPQRGSTINMRQASTSKNKRKSQGADAAAERPKKRPKLTEDAGPERPKLKLASTSEKKRESQEADAAGPERPKERPKLTEDEQSNVFKRCYYNIERQFSLPEVLGLKSSDAVKLAVQRSMLYGPCQKTVRITGVRSHAIEYALKISRFVQPLTLPFIRPDHPNAERPTLPSIGEHFID